jgi:high-affinity iron transporter
MGLRVLAALALALGCSLAAAQGAPADAQTILHLLDYVGVDYSEAVADGRVKNADEYREMLEFTGQVRTRIGGLAANPRQSDLAAQADALAALVRTKAEPKAVADAAASLRRALIEAYGIQVAPRRSPDLAAAPALYREHCASCHGTDGHGDGPAAKGLDPAPADFHDAARMAKRSAYGLYSTITLGIAGTAMAPFGGLSEDERWALAFYVAGLRAAAGTRAEGEAAWRSGELARAFPDLASVASLSAEEIRARFGARAVLAHAYLLANPAALAAGKPAPLALASAKLDESLAAYRAGDRTAAQRLAVQAYLEGFELVEASLQHVDPDLVPAIEREMMALRALMRDAAPIDEVAARAAGVAALLARAEQALASDSLSARTIFASALLILVREGLEALLVVAAIIAFLVKAGRRDALPYVHAGWAGAIALGLLTWIAAAELVEVSGAARELTEGLTALVASAMLVYVGYWLHTRASARAWSGFIREQVGAALAGRTLWAMAAVAFLAVYREMFETALFFQALWVQAGYGGRSAFFGGIVAGVALLAVIAWAIFRYGVRLPLGPFFTVTSLLLCTLAVVLAGKGIAALQEAGAIGADPVAFIRVPALGIFPTLQGVGAQAFVLAAVAALLWYSRFATRHGASAPGRL